MTQAAAAPLARGLEGVIAGETAICNVEQSALIYRGYEIADLAAHATFEQVAFLLLEGHKPSAPELARFIAEVVAERGVPPLVVDFLRSAVPALKAGTAVPMDALRTAVSILAHIDPDCQSVQADANLRKSKRLLAKIPTVIGAMQRLIEGREPIEPGHGGDPELSHAANLLYMMTGSKPSSA